MSGENICDILHIFGDAFCQGRYIRYDKIVIPEPTPEPTPTPEPEITYPDPVFLKELTMDDIQNALRSHRINILWQPIDATYKEVSFASIKEFLKINTVSEEAYVPEFHDCDDFAFETYVDMKRWAPGVPVALIILNGHAINGFICDGLLYFIEPQTDVIYSKLDSNYYINIIIL